MRLSLICVRSALLLLSTVSRFVLAFYFVQTLCVLAPCPSLLVLARVAVAARSHAPSRLAHRLFFRAGSSPLCSGPLSLFSFSLSSLPKSNGLRGVNTPKFWESPFGPTTIQYPPGVNTNYVLQRPCGPSPQPPREYKPNRPLPPSQRVPTVGV
eukprot:scaffold80_cov106-Isochrysis_galbana.AAC.11